MRIDIVKWCVSLHIGWRIVALNWEWPRWELGLKRDWVDGPHSAFIVGPLNVYWNW